MIWLSMASFNKEKWAGLDSYGQHKVLWRAFPGRDGEKRSFLFRVDDMGRMFRVYVLSAVKPVFLESESWQVKEVAETFLGHDKYRFQLKANPTMRRKEDGRRLGLFREDLLRAWMLRKAEINGFTIDDGTLVVGAPVEERFRHGLKTGKHIAVNFMGILRVVDKKLFTKAFVEGIGSAKGFGFGLLVLQPI